MRITAYTVILDNYDNLRPPLQQGAGRYICFSDHPRWVAPWETQPFPQLFAEASRNCRIPKCLPHLLFDADVSIYMDGAFRMLMPPEAAADVLGDADIALYAHPGGHLSYHDERNFYQKLHGYVPDDVEATYQRYVAENLPVSGQFYAGGVVIRRHNAAVDRFNELWFREYAHGTYNDQFGLYYAIVKSGVKVATIPGIATMDTVRFGYCLHANSRCGDNPVYEGENAAWRARVDRMRSLIALIGLLRVKNEARWIERSISSILPVCDRVLVMDDHSSDGTPDLCGAIERVTVFPSPFSGLDETRDKNWLLDKARSADWVMMIDGDEMLAPGAVLPQILATNAACLSLRILYLWDREDQVRVDGVYGRFRRPSIFRPGASRFRSTSAGGNFHCGNVPLALQALSRPIDASLLHFGYLHKEDRLRKYHFYNQNDPRNGNEDGYRHVVQGDIPEVPVGARLRHAGPLELVALESVASQRSVTRVAGHD